MYRIFFFLKILPAVTQQQKKLFQFRKTRLKIWHGCYKNQRKPHFGPGPLHPWYGMVSLSNNGYSKTLKMNK